MTDCACLRLEVDYLIRVVDWPVPIKIHMSRWIDPKLKKCILDNEFSYNVWSLCLLDAFFRGWQNPSLCITDIVVKDYKGNILHEVRYHHD